MNSLIKKMARYFCLKQVKTVLINFYHDIILKNTYCRNFKKITYTLLIKKG